MLIEKQKLEDMEQLIKQAGRITKLQQLKKTENDKEISNFLKTTVESLGYSMYPAFYKEKKENGLLMIDVDKDTLNYWLHTMAQCNLYLFSKMNENTKLFENTWKEMAGDMIGKAYDILLTAVLFRNCEDAEAIRLRMELVKRGWFG